MSEEIRIRCPMCGMLPYLSYLRETLAKSEAQIEIILMTIGGRNKGEWKTDKRGKYRLVAGGKIEYKDITAAQPQLLRELKAEILSQIEKIQTLMETIP